MQAINLLGYKNGTAVRAKMKVRSMRSLTRPAVAWMGGVAEIHSVVGWLVGRWWQDVRLLEMRLSLAQHCLVRADVDLHERVAALSQIESALVRQSTRVGMPQLDRLLQHQGRHTSSVLRLAPRIIADPALLPRASQETLACSGPSVTRSSASSSSSSSAPPIDPSHLVLLLLRYLLDATSHPPHAADRASLQVPRQPNLYIHLTSQVNLISSSSSSPFACPITFDKTDLPACPHVVLQSGLLRLLSAVTHANPHDCRRCLLRVAGPHMAPALLSCLACPLTPEEHQQLRAEAAAV